MRDFLNFLTWQHQKRSNSARIPSKMERWVRADGLVPMRFTIFPVHLSKLLRLPRKSDTGSYEVLHLSRKIISANLKIWCSKMQPPSGIQRPDLLTALMNMSLVLRLPGKMHLCRSSSNVPRLPSFWTCYKTLTLCSLLARCNIPTRLPRETTSERPKVVRTCGVFRILTSKCASRHNGVHFFGISTSKGDPKLVCFVHFDFEMCFAPQRRALFQHVNFQKCSDVGVFCTFWLGNVLRARTACTFLISQLPKVVRTWGVLYIFTSKCASRHNSVQVFISHPARWLRTRRFSEPTFWPSGAFSTVFRDFFYLFPHLHLLSSDSFSSLIFSLLFSSLLFSSLLFSASSNLCFSICPYCRKIDF